MTPERWARVQALFEEALARPSAEREDWVGARADDPDLAALVASMLHADEVSSFLVSLFELNDPSRSRGETVTARELLDRGAMQVESGLASRPVAQARLMDTIGRVYRQLGLLGPATALLEKALARREAAVEGFSDDVADTLAELGEVWRENGEYAQAERLHRSCPGDAPAVARPEPRQSRVLDERPRPDARCPGPLPRGRDPAPGRHRDVAPGSPRRWPRASTTSGSCCA